MGKGNQVTDDGQLPILSTDAGDRSEVAVARGGGGEVHSVPSVPAPAVHPSVEGDVERGGGVAATLPVGVGTAGLSELPNNPADPNDEDFMMFGFGC